ncbi:MAG: Wadjet anti-phage system protein JetD domain-containing protein [Acidimicrobiales bacterium]
MTTGWTTVADLVVVLRKRWDSGLYLKRYLAGEAWESVSLPVKGPAAGDLLDRLDESRRWLQRFERDAVGFGQEHKVVQNRHLGANRIPARVRVDSFEQLCEILGAAADVRTAEAQIESAPELRAWVAANPMAALRNADVWGEALGVVRWISSHDTSRLYLRQIDVEGVDTKFVERHHRLLEQLLTIVLPLERIHPEANGFAGRFGFLDKPAYVRFRMLDPCGAFTEMTVRVEELAAVVPPAANVFIVENEITYLAFPPVPRSLVVFGSGFALTRLASLPWLHGKGLVYWGDIDTHGFSILDRLRSRFASVRSILMDRATLLAHSRQWVTEPSPTARALPHLTEQEKSLYRDMVEGVYGRTVRLEQERIRFSILESALHPWR